MSQSLRSTEVPDVHGLVVVNPDGTNIGSASGGSTSQYTLRVDDGDTYMYIGQATPGTATSAASWRIKRLTQADLTIVWADGDSSFNNVWDDHATLSYS